MGDRTRAGTDRPATEKAAADERKRAEEQAEAARTKAAADKARAEKEVADAEKKAAAAEKELQEITGRGYRVVKAITLDSGRTLMPGEGLPHYQEDPWSEDQVGAWVKGKFLERATVEEGEEDAVSE